MKTLNETSILTAMITPFDDKGELALNKVQSVVDYLIEHQTKGIVVGGTTGEAPTLTEEEKLALYEATINASNGRVPIVCGVGTNDTAASVAFIKKVAELDGVTAALCVVPYYNRPSQEGLYQHFKAISEASELPIILYNVPKRTAANLEVATTLRLAKLPNVIGIKECQGLEALATIIANKPDDFLVYSGEDHLAFPAKIIGATGIISVTAHVAGDKMSEMYQAIENKKIEKAAKIHGELLPIYEAVFSVPSPAPVKAVYNAYGLAVGEPRLPLVSCTNEEKENILTVLEKIDKH